MISEMWSKESKFNKLSWSGLEQWLCKERLMDQDWPSLGKEPWRRGYSWCWNRSFVPDTRRRLFPMGTAEEAKPAPFLGDFQSQQEQPWSAHQPSVLSLLQQDWARDLMSTYLTWLYEIFCLKYNGAISRLWTQGFPKEFRLQCDFSNLFVYENNIYMEIYKYEKYIYIKRGHKKIK